MTDNQHAMAQRFGSFRALLQKPLQTPEQQKALSALITSALEHNSTLFRQQWLPYLRQSPACAQHVRTMASLRELLLQRGPLDVTMHNHQEHRIVDTIEFRFGEHHDVSFEDQYLREILETILGHVAHPLNREKYGEHHKLHLLALGQLKPDEHDGVLLSYVEAYWETQQEHTRYPIDQFDDHDEIMALYPRDLWMLDIEDDASHYHVRAHTLLQSNVPNDEIGDHIIRDTLKYLQRAMTRREVTTYDVTTTLLLKQFSKTSGMQDQ